MNEPYDFQLHLLISEYFFQRNLNLHVWNMKLCIEQCQALSKLSNLAPQCILLLLRPQTHVRLAFAATERKR